MILVDSNILIDFWKHPSVMQSKIFHENEVAVCGVVESEILRGSQSEKQYTEIQNALLSFNYLVFEENNWLDLARMFITLRKNGIKIPFQDGMIACLAIKNDIPVWTDDKHFTLIQSVIPELKLFNPDEQG